MERDEFEKFMRELEKRFGIRVDQRDFAENRAKRSKHEEIELDPEQKELIDKLGIEIDEPEEEPQGPKAFAFRINEEGKPEFRIGGKFDKETLRQIKDKIENGGFKMIDPHHEASEEAQEIKNVDVLIRKNCGTDGDAPLEPFTDVFEEGDEVHIITEMPGISPKDLRFMCDLDDPKKVYLHAAAGTKNYEKTICLTKEIDLNKIKGKKRHGIIHLAIQAAA